MQLICRLENTIGFIIELLSIKNQNLNSFDFSFLKFCLNCVIIFLGDSNERKTK